MQKSRTTDMARAILRLGTVGAQKKGFEQSPAVVGKF
jgi:hypothetical protein